MSFPVLPAEIRQSTTPPVARAILLAAIFLLAPGTVRSATLYDSGGFEPPRFLSASDLEGQDAPPVGQGPWVADSGVGTAVVQSAVVSGGVQAIRVTRVANAFGDSRWAVAKPFTPTAAENIVAIDIDLRVDQATFVPLDFGPAFGIEMYDASNVANLQLIGSITLDARTGDVLYQAAGSGALAETGTILARGVFHHFRISANFTSRTYSIFANGNLLRVEGFVDSGAAVFTDAPISTFAATNESRTTAAGTAYFDNYVITTIPEPHQLAFLGLAAAGFGFGARRRRPPGRRATCPAPVPAAAGS